MDIEKRCLHCGQSFRDNNDDVKFCCNGCASAYEIIKRNGLGKYYTERIISKTSRPLVPADHSNINFEDFIRINNENNVEIYLMVDGVHCAACIWVIETILNKMRGVINARLNMTTKRLHIVWDKSETDINSIIKEVTKIGYKLGPYNPDLIETENKKYEKKLLLSMAVAGFACANIMLLSISVWSGTDMGENTKKMMHLVSSLIALPAVAYSGSIFFKSAISSIKNKSYNMDIPISLAVIMTTIISVVNSINNNDEVYFESVTMLLFFLLIGRYLEHMTRKRANISAENLLMLSNKTSLKMNEKTGKIEAIPVNKINKDDILVIASGETIPADSVITAPSKIAQIDKSVISGESIICNIYQDEVIASGSINCGNPINVKVVRKPSDSTLAQIASLIDNQKKSSNKYILMSEKLAQLYIPMVHILAFLTFFTWFLMGDWYAGMINAAAVLIVTCPCALALAVPVVHTLCTSKLLKKSILLKNPDALDKLKDATDIIFDKTGTLTTGKLSIKNKINEEELSIASTIASYSNHPIAKALKYNAKTTYKIKNIEEVAGKGLTAEIGKYCYKLGSAEFCDIPSKDTVATSTYLKNEMTGKITKIELEDTIREDAATVIESLKITPHIVSGDNKNSVANTANILNIKDYHYEKSPEEKLAYIQKLKSEKHICIMAGDGINDAPTLKAADVAISFSNSHAITQNSSDIIINNDKLSSITECIKLSKKANSIIKQNVTISIIYNILSIPMAAMGFISPLLAAILMSVSSITVIINSMRILK